MQPRENEKKDKMKQKKKQHNEVNEIDYICHSHVLLNQHEARNLASRVRIRKLRQSLSCSDRNEQRDSSRLRMQMIRLNQLVKLDRIAFQYNSEIEYSLHPVVVIESMNKVCTHCNALKFKNEAPGMCCLNGTIEGTT